MLDFDIYKLARNKKAVLFLSLVISQYVIYLFIFNSSNTARFYGDTHEYQSIAVNFAYGNGFPIYDIFDYEVHKFDTKDKTTFKAYPKHEGFNFYRTPGYPFLVGSVYKFFGVSPAIIKYLQLLLIVIVASILPFIGGYFWSKKGFYAGLVACFIFSITHYTIAERILTESLIIFWLCLISVVAILYGKQEKIIFSILLGICFGIGMLIKGSLIFIPILFIVSRIHILYKKNKYIQLILITVFTIAPVLPWSVYVSDKIGTFTLLSTQTEEVLLDGNNEYCAKSGLWSPEWEKNPDSYYNNDNQQLSPIKRVIDFYLTHPDLIINSFINKIYSGFFVNPFFLIFFLLIIFKYLKESFKEPKYFYISSTVILAICGISILLHLAYAIKFEKILFLNPYISFLEPFSLLMKLLIVLILTFSFIKIYSNLPIIFNIVFINFLFLTLLTIGERRYTGTMDFIVIFLSCIIFFQYLPYKKDKRLHNDFKF